MVGQYNRSGYWWNAHNYSFYFGKTFRFKGIGHNTFELYYEKYAGGGCKPNFLGFGFRFEDYGKGNSAGSLKIIPSALIDPSSLQNHILIPYWAFSPIIFIVDGKRGFSIKPEVGIRLNTGSKMPRSPFSLSFLASYGYDLPLIRWNSFKMGRSDFCYRFGLSYAIAHGYFDDF